MKVVVGSSIAGWMVCLGIAVSAGAAPSPSLRECKDADLYVVVTPNRQVSSQVTCAQLRSDAAYACALESKKALGLVDLGCLQMTTVWGLGCARLSWNEKRFADLNCAKIQSARQKECAENSLTTSGMVNFNCFASSVE